MRSPAIPINQKLKAGAELTSVIKSQETALQMVHYLLTNVSPGEFLEKTNTLCSFLGQNPTLCSQLIEDKSSTIKKCAFVFESCFNNKSIDSHDWSRGCLKSILKSHTNRKRKFSEHMHENKSVGFHMGLEEIKFIPTKEELQASCLYNDAEFFAKSLEKVFWSQEYVQTRQKQMELYPAFDKQDSWDNVSEYMGKSFLMKDGSVIKVVLLCRKLLFGKVFRRLSSLRKCPEDYYEFVETDLYIRVLKSQVVCECEIRLVTEPFQRDANGLLQSQNPEVRYFFYSWYFNFSKNLLVPYDLIGRKVKIHRSHLDQFVEGIITATDSTNQKFCVSYRSEGETEWVSLSHLRQQNHLSFPS